MARRASFEPRKTDAKKTAAGYPWSVNIPGHLAQSGKRERRYFATKAEAETFATTERIRVENYGRSTTVLTPGQVEQAAVAFKRLEGTGAKLSEAVEHYLAHRRRLAMSENFRTIFERFEGLKADKSPHYLTQIRCAKSKMEALLDKPASEVGADDIEQALAKLPPASRNSHLRVIKAVFNHAVKKGKLERSPVPAVDWSEIKGREVAVFTAAQAKAILLQCAKSDPGLLAYYAIGFFAGIRPEEIRRLAWENINFAELDIVMPGDITKKKRRRIVPMEPALVAWLRRCVGGTNPTGLIVPMSNAVLRKRWRAVQAAAKVPWIQDGMRHSYASYWLAQHGDVDKLTVQLGHTSPAMLWKHYHRAVTKKDAAAFWAIRPPVSRSKVVKFTA